MECPNCHHLNPADANYCLTCGHLLNPSLMQEAPSQSFAKEMGTEDQNSSTESRMTRYHAQNHLGRKPELARDESGNELEDTPVIKQSSQSVIDSKREILSVKNIVGMALIALAAILLFMVYQLNYSKGAVESQFIRAIEKQDYLKAASFVKTPLTKEAWTDLDIERTITHYQTAQVDLVGLIESEDLTKGISWQGQPVVSLERVGSFLLLFPRYGVNFHPLPANFTLSNNMRQIKLVSPLQKEQAVKADTKIAIEPRIEEIAVVYQNQGSQEEALIELDYSQLKEGAHSLSLLPVTQQIEIDKKLLGIRPNLPFEILSYQIDGQGYQEDQISLSGLEGQSFEVAIEIRYNGQVIQSDPVSLRLEEGSKLILDLTQDQEFQDQVRQAELKV